MRSQQPAPFQPPSPPAGPYWTAGKIVGLVLVVVLITGVSGIAAVNYLRQPSGSSNACTNGATNYPSCSSCPGGQTYFVGTCYVGNFGISGTSPSPVPVGTTATSTITVTPINGFIGKPDISFGGQYLAYCTSYGVDARTFTVSCSSSTPGGIVVTATGTFGSLVHSASVMFSFFTPTCSNGATNYPDCSIFTTTTSISCSATSIESHSLNSTSCRITVTTTAQSPTEPAGTVGFTASGTSSWTANGAPCTLTLATGYAYCDITDVSTAGPAGTMTIYAEYGGDSTHSHSTGSASLKVVDPPGTVTVSGSVSTVGAGTSPYQIQFVDYATGVGYTSAVTSGSYSISLTNLRTYNVVVYWTGALGSSGTCSGGTLNLQSSTDNWYANYRC